jgi:hypothetical protein
MFAIIYLLGTFIADLLKSRRPLEVENLSFPKIRSGRHHAVRRISASSNSLFAIILPAWNMYHARLMPRRFEVRPLSLLPRLDSLFLKSPGQLARCRLAHLQPKSLCFRRSMA